MNDVGELRPLDAGFAVPVGFDYGKRSWLLLGSALIRMNNVPAVKVFATSTQSPSRNSSGRVLIKRSASAQVLEQR